MGISIIIKAIMARAMAKRAMMRITTSALELMAEHINGIRIDDRPM